MQLFIDAQNEAYLDFSRLDEESVSKLLSLFDVFVFRTLPFVSFNLLHLDSPSIFIDSLFDSNEVSLVVLPTKIANMHLESILKAKEARPVCNIQSFPEWNLKKSKHGLLQFDPSQMFTTDTLLPFLDPQKPFRKHDTSSGRNSNQLSQEEVFNAFFDIHKRKSIRKWPVSMNLQQVAGITTEQKPLSVILKVYVPHLNVTYNHSVHHLDSHTPFEQIWQIFGKATRMKHFYLFYEVQANPTKKDKYYLIPFLEMLQSPVQLAYSQYWPIISSIFVNKLFLKMRPWDGSQGSVLGHIIRSPPYMLHSFILIPSVLSLYPQLQRPLSDAPLQPKPTLNPPVNPQSGFNSIPQTPTGSSSQRKSNRIESERNTPKKSTQNISEQVILTASPGRLVKTGKRAFPGLVPNEESPNSDSNWTRRPTKKVQVEEVEVVSERNKGQNSTRLLYLDLSILLSFLELFRSFENLMYFQVSNLETKQLRKFAIDADLSDFHFYKMLNRRFLNEKHYLQHILKQNNLNKGAQLLFPNGNLCYANGPSDKYLSSISDPLPVNIFNHNKHFKSMKGSPHIKFL